MVRTVLKEKQTKHSTLIDKYHGFIKASISNVEKTGAYIPKNTTEKSPVKPLWWTEDCKWVLGIKKTARKTYIKDLTDTNLKVYIESEKEASKVMYECKKKSFRDLCDSINPTMGSKRILGLIKVFQGKFSTPKNSSNDPDAEEFNELKDELIKREVGVIPTPRKVVLERTSPYNLPFSVEEFNTALSSCNKESSPGLDQVSFEALCSLPKEGKDYFMTIMNECFKYSEFPDT